MSRVASGGLLSNLSHIRGEVGDMTPASMAAAVVVGLRAVHVMNRLIDTVGISTDFSSAKFTGKVLCLQMLAKYRHLGRHRKTMIP